MGKTLSQYWLYFPESFTGGIGRPLGHRWPGYHPDDWEGVQMRIDEDGSVSARATAHGGYGDGWKRWRGWYRVSGGSHAGQIAGEATGERTTQGSAVRLVPLESLGGGDSYSFAVSPPWRKAVYADPEVPKS